MANQQALKDENSVSTLLGVLNTDGVTTIRVKANPITHGLKYSDGSTGSNNGPNHALKDDNDVSTLLLTSNADGTSPLAAYCDSSGNLLIKST